MTNNSIPIPIPPHITQKVQSALHGLVRAVRQKPAAAAVVQNLEHTLLHLCRQQESLQAGLDGLQNVAWPAVVQKLQHDASPETVATLLTHIFTQLLRLHDGLILCISGECRHVGDELFVAKTAATAAKPKSKQQQQQRFPSQLVASSSSFSSSSKNTNNTTRADGYTQLYRPGRVYKGTGWDELTNETAGLQVRLYRAWRTTTVQNNTHAAAMEWWDRFVSDRHAPGLELLLQQVENQTAACQERFVELARVMTRDLQRTLPQCTKAQLKLDDKMESWQVEWCNQQQPQQQKHVCKLGRFASQFQVTDPQGVLPETGRWKSILQLPRVGNTGTAKNDETNKAALKRKKRRRIVVESDEEEEEDDDDKQPLQHQQQHQRKRKQKQHAGIKVQTTQITAPTNHDDATQQSYCIRTIKEQHGATQELLSEAREALEAEMAETQVAADEIDDAAQESAALDDAVRQVQHLQSVLRKSLLRRRRRLCDDTSAQETVWNARECLRQASMEAGNLLLWKEPDKALPYFEQARQLVRAQQEALPGMTTSDRFMYLRNLLLLHGQATVNVGIAQIEQGQWRMALTELEQAVQTAKAIARESTDEEDRGMAQKLECLAQRWWGTTLWHQGRFKEAVQHFELAAGLKKSTDAYLAWTTLSDVASQYLESATVAKLRECPALLEDVYTYALRGLREAASVSNTMVAANEELGDDILSEQELLKVQREMDAWWKRKKESSTQRIVLDQHKTTHHPRSDVLGDGPFDESAPTSRLVWNGDRPQKKPKKNRIKGNAGYSNIGPSAKDPRPTAPKRKYRPWGDELLPQTIDKETGTQIPKLVYPSIAPQMPPEFVASATRWQTSGSTR